MKQKIIFLVLVILIPVFANADIIYLIDGRKLTCKEYWKDGDNIKYRYMGATVTIPERKVWKIEKSNVANYRHTSGKRSSLKNDDSQDYQKFDSRTFKTDGCKIFISGHRFKKKIELEGTVDGYVKKKYSKVRIRLSSNKILKKTIYGKLKKVEQNTYIIIDAESSLRRNASKDEKWYIVGAYLSR